ncbi:MAG: M4 family metallopeptidase, partial [Gammaproteobacteria bacterium]|nr:M4 family metallopeptidase [Gammaproteobacteria bacterium]
MKTFKLQLVLLSVLLLSACGGGGGNDNSGDNGGNVSEVKTGYFRDSAVKGLTYKTATQSGITNLAGAYQYKVGENITFSLGRLILGSAMATEALYPHSIAKDYDDSIRIAQLLQTLDADSNLNNGIDVENQFKGSDIALPENLSQSYINQHTYTSKILITKEAAQTHLQNTYTQYGVNNSEAHIYIIGNTVENATLTTKITDIAGVPNSGITYQWYADNIQIAGKTKSTLTLSQEHTNKIIKVQASFKDLLGVLETPEQETPPHGVNIGYFKGSAIKGLTYKTQTQTGKTNGLGGYLYKAGEPIEFYLGDLYLGQSLATTVLYLSNIANSNIEMIKITQLLQTLDADDNPNNGIDVDRNFVRTEKYLPNGALSQAYINSFDSSKTLVNEATARQFLTKTIQDNRNIEGYSIVSNEVNIDLGFLSEGVREVIIPTLACAQVSCCKAEVLKDTKVDNTIVDQNNIIRFNVQQQSPQSITVKLKPVGEQTCYYKTPIVSSVKTLSQAQTTLPAKGDGNDYPALNTLQPNQHYYLQDTSRSASIKTIKAIGLGNNNTIEHTAIDAPHLDKDGVDAHANSIKVHDYLKTVLGMNSYDNNNASLSATTNYLYPRTHISSCGSTSSAGSWYNAFHSGGHIYYTPAKPDQGYNKSLSSITHVVAHEWGHAVTNKASNLNYLRESGAMNEAFSDWLGIAVEQYYTIGDKSWLIGLPDKPFRSLKNPSSQSRTYRDYKDYKIFKNGQVHTPTVGDKIPYPDTYKGDNWRTTDNTNCPNSNYCQNDNCGVHVNSSVANKMFYLLSVGGTHNNIEVTGIGINNAMKIALDANKNQWTNTTTFHNAKAGMIAAAASHGNTDTGINMQTQVRLAWEAVKVLDTNKP